VFRLCREDGVDPRTDPVPTAPAAHYHMGGIVTGGSGRSSLFGLWAVGEAARTGVHGANRLASNSLLEGVVFGRRAADDIAATGVGPVSVAAALRVAPEVDPSPDPQPDVVGSLRDLMWERVGLVRDDAGLTGALEEMDRIDEKLAPGTSEGRNMLVAARLITRAALMRTESRGGHFRADYPDTDPAWARPIVLP
jgi:L-aspartate oxidase